VNKSAILDFRCNLNRWLCCVWGYSLPQRYTCWWYEMWCPRTPFYVKINSWSKYAFAPKRKVLSGEKGLRCTGYYFASQTHQKQNKVRNNSVKFNVRYFRRALDIARNQKWFGTQILMMFLQLSMSCSHSNASVLSCYSQFKSLWLLFLTEFLGTLRLTVKKLLLVKSCCILAIAATYATKAYCCIPAVYCGLRNNLPLLCSRCYWEFCN
jgi:hypothetical protein